MGPAKTPPPRVEADLPHVAGTTVSPKENFRLAQERSVSNSIAVLRHRFPGALLCTACSRIIATTAAGYATSRLTPEQIENYVCHGCRFDTDPARSAEVTARFAASRAAAAASRLRPPFIANVHGTIRAGAPGTVSEIVRLDDACSCTEAITCAVCLLTRAAEAAHGRRVAHEYLGTSAMDGRHNGSHTPADCPLPCGNTAPSVPPVVCTHARPVDNCIVHAPHRLQPAMPAKLARCGSCLGYHGKTGRDRCPYSQKEAGAVKASRAAAMAIAKTPGMPTGSRKSMAPNSVTIQPNSVAALHRTIPHLANASKRLRRKPGRPATGTSKWAALRRAVSAYDSTQSTPTSRRTRCQS
jgi:hypothetical protein